MPKSPTRTPLLAAAAFAGAALIAAGGWYGYSAYSRKEAKQDLESVGISYSEANFIEEACNGNRVAVVLFLKTGMSVNTKGKDDVTPLHCAARHGYDKLAVVLIGRGADLNAQAKDGRTPLIEAAQKGSPETVRVLLDAGAKVNDADRNGNTPLLAAAGSYQTQFKTKADVVTLLLERGADPKAKNRNGEGVLSRLFANTSYQANAAADALALADTLIKKGADVNARNGADQSVLYMAVAGGQKQLVERLIEAGADINAKGRNGTPLMAAAMRPEMLKLLLDAKADPNGMDEQGNFPLAMAARQGQVEAVKLLLDAGATANPPMPPARETALHAAAQAAQADAIKALLRSAVDVDARNAQGDTALHVIARNAYANEAMRMEAARQLVAFGARLDLPSREGKTPAELASQVNAPNLAALLTPAGSSRKGSTPPRAVAPMPVPMPYVSIRPPTVHGIVAAPAPAPAPSPH